MNSRHALRTAAAGLIAVAGLASGSLTAGAAQRGSVGVGVGHFDPNIPETRGHFILNLVPGASYSDYVVVTNQNDTPFPVYAYPADGGTSDASGEFYGTRSDPLRKAGSWITSAVTSLTVPPRSSAHVNFVVKVPLGTTPGDHLAAMVFEPEHPEGPGGAYGVTSIVRAAMPILVQVPGPGAFHLLISGVSIQARAGQGTSSIVVALANDGNRKGKPTLSITLKGPDGYLQTEPTPDCAPPKQQFCGQLDYVLPGDAIHFPFPWLDDLATGDYAITVTGSWGTAERVTFTGSYHLSTALKGTPATPPPAAVQAAAPIYVQAQLSLFWTVVLPLIVGLGGALVFLVVFLLVRRRGRRPTGGDSPAPS